MNSHGAILRDCDHHIDALEDQYDHMNNTRGTGNVGWKSGNDVLLQNHHQGNIMVCKKMY